MLFSPHGLLVKIGSFDIAYSNKLDKLFFLKEQKAFELLGAEKLVSVQSLGSHRDKNCLLYLEENTTKYLAKFCLSKISSKIEKLISGKYSMSSYLKKYYQGVYGIRYPVKDGEMAPRMLETVNRNSGKSIQSEELTGYEILSEDAVRDRISGIKAEKKCQRLGDCLKLAKKSD